MWILTAVALVLSVSLSHAENCTERTIEGKNVIVTGGGKGIGYEVADQFLAEGASYVVIVEPEKELCEAAALNLTSKYGEGKCECINADLVTDVDKVMEAVHEKCGGTLDIMVNAARKFDENYPDEMISINLISQMKWTEKMYQMTRKDKDGLGSVIICISDMFAYAINRFQPYLKACSAGSQKMCQTLGHPLRYEHTGVAVFSALPGFTTIEMVPEEMEKAEYADMYKNYAAKWKWQTPAQAAKTIMDVYKVAATGSTYTVEGGNYYVSPPVDNAEDIEQYETTC